jgi:hypothetical protein
VAPWVVAAEDLLHRSDVASEDENLLRSLQMGAFNGL